MNVAPKELGGRPFLGCIADDVTGATDMASNLVLGGMRTVQFFGVPEPGELQSINADAIVVALKSRSIEPGLAIKQSIRSLNALKTAGASRFFFKYCSTFDSTEKGNIGPVAEAMMDALNIRQTIFCPAFPVNGRTVYQGHLFVHDQLLNESGMESHPLNPMSDANLVRVLAAQTNRRVGLLDYRVVASGQVDSQLSSLAANGVSMVIVDACDDQHLKTIATHVSKMTLLTGGSGIARYLPAAWSNTGAFSQASSSSALQRTGGRTAILSGSCSMATNRQVAFMKTRCPSFELEIDSIVEQPEQQRTKLIEFLDSVSDDAPVLIYSTSLPAAVKAVQSRFGAALVAERVEDFFSSLAQLLTRQFGFRGLIIAGGETAGAITKGLGIKSIRIGAEICPGVPWTQTIEGDPLTLVLKSGNFGEEDFFETAAEIFV